MANIKYFITHLIVNTPPTSGLRKLFFYTVKEGNEGPIKYYYGKGNNSFSQDKIKEQVIKGKAVMLPQEIELEDKKGLWVDRNGQVFYADLKAPNNDPNKKDLNFTPKELKRPSIEYNAIKAKFGIPKVTLRQKLFS